MITTSRPRALVAVALGALVVTVLFVSAVLGTLDAPLARDPATSRGVLLAPVLQGLAVLVTIAVLLVAFIGARRAQRARDRAAGPSNLNRATLDGVSDGVARSGEVGRVRFTSGAQRAKLLSILDALPIQVAVLDEAGRVVEVNAAWRQDGCRGEGVGPGTSLLDAFRRDGTHASWVADGVRDVLTGGRASFKAEHSWRAGEDLRWCQVQAVPLQGLEGARVLIAQEDVTDRVLSQLATQRHSNQLRQLAELANLVNTAQDVRTVLSLVADRARQIVEAFHAAVHVTLEGPSGLVLQAESPEATQPTRNGPPPWHEALGSPIVGVTRLPAESLEASPSWRHLLTSLGLRAAPDWMGAPLVARDGRHLGVLHLLARPGHPFTDEDESIVAQVARLATSAVEGAWLYEELRAGDRRKDEFLATLAHELRNPLAPVRTAVEILRRAPREEARAEVTAVLDRQVRHMVRLIDDLLDMSRITRGKLALRVERLELGAVIRHAVEASRPAIDAAGGQLALSLPLEPVHVYGDHARLSQVFANLLHNAAKYSEPGGRIEVSLDASAREATVRVSDEGAGIDPGTLPRVFDMFEQGNDAHGHTRGGLGIGLTLARSIVELHGGRVEAASPGRGHGSTFTVRVPLAASVRTPTEPSALPAEEPRPPARRHRVLVVDDNPDAAESLSMLLRLEGHEVRVAADGEAALAAAAEFQPSVALLDIGLPDMSGYDVARALRRDQRTTGCLLVALTGWGQDSDRQRSAEAGLDYHLVKPVGLEALARVLDAR